VALSWAGWARAETLGELLPQLLEEHERIKASESRTQATEYQVRQAYGGWLPRLDFSGEVSREEIDAAGEDTQASVETRNTQTLRLTQLLWDFGAVNSNIDQAQALKRQAMVDLYGVKQTLMFEGIQAYLNAIKAHKRLVYARRSEERIKTQTGIEESLVEKGAGIEPDVLQAKQQLAGARALLVTAEGEMANAGNRFRAVFGREITEQDIKDFTMPPPPAKYLPAKLGQAIETAIEQNPSLDSARQNVDIAEAQKGVAQSRYFPTFSAFGEVSREENDAGAYGVRHESNVGLAVAWNLFAGGQDYYAVRTAGATASQARYTVHDLARTVEEQVRVAWQNLKTFRANADYLENQANINGRFLELTRERRKRGEDVRLLDILYAEVTYINAISTAVTAKIDTRLAAYNVLYTMGALDTTMFQ
jgi:adhesin transport system outer membrane protein